ncbi:PHB depolymerase family esterase [Streptomyces pseudoechinosporeus]
MHRLAVLSSGVTALCALLLPSVVAPPAAASETSYGESPRAGCGLPAGRTTLTVSSGGLERTVVVHVPRRLRGLGQVPMVLNLHGSQSTAEEQLDRSQMEETADREGFLLVAPQGSLVASPGYRWNVPYVTGVGGPDDEQFLSDTIDTLVSTGCTDPRKVYATGYSGGARMASQYACDHPGRLAAIATVAGLRAGAPVEDADGGFVPDPATCAPGRAVPVLSFAGTADPVNPYAGGGAAYWGYGEVTALQRWATLNGCRQGPWRTQVTEHVSRVTYSACSRGADVMMYVVDGGGHTWPGSTGVWPPYLGTVTHEISANELMWRFFLRHGGRGR